MEKKQPKWLRRFPSQQNRTSYIMYTRKLGVPYYIHWDPILLYAFLSLLALSLFLFNSLHSLSLFPSLQMRISVFIFCLSSKYFVQILMLELKVFVILWPVRNYFVLCACVCVYIRVSRTLKLQIHYGSIEYDCIEDSRLLLMSAGSNKRANEWKGRAVTSDSYSNYSFHFDE